MWDWLMRLILRNGIASLFAGFPSPVLHRFHKLQKKYSPVSRIEFPAFCGPFNQSRLVL